MPDVSPVYQSLAAISAFALTASLIVLLYNLFTAPRLERNARPREYPKVSVLLPARNEASNLARILPLWAAQDYPDWELLVLDDQSGDTTWELLGHYETRHPRLRRLRGDDLPPGWRGKNWACHQLSQHAQGEILLFADCDVEPAPHALRASIATLQAENAQALSALGSQRQSHWATQAILPLALEMPLSAWIPLRLALESPHPALSAAIGQWFVFTREAYTLCGGHAAVASQTVEDLALARLLKKYRQRLAVCWARDAITVEMYDSLQAVWNGFSKNIASLAGSGAMGFFATAALIGLFYIVPMLSPLWLGYIGCIPLALLLVLRLAISRLWGHGIATTLWHLPGTLLLLCIFVRSAFTPLRPVAWKGRSLCRINAKPS